MWGAGWPSQRGLHQTAVLEKGAGALLRTFMGRLMHKVSQRSNLRVPDKETVTCIQVKAWWRQGQTDPAKRVTEQPQKFSKDQRIQKKDSEVEKNQHGDQGRKLPSCHCLYDTLPKDCLCFWSHLVLVHSLNLTSVLFLVAENHQHLRSALWFGCNRAGGLCLEGGLTAPLVGRGPRSTETKLQWEEAGRASF